MLSFRVKIISSILILLIGLNAAIIDPDKTVNPATGEMAFSIPLVNMQGENGNDFPIYLNYQAGIRYRQSASYVGLGFSLGVGGISRKVIFMPDDNLGGSSNYERVDIEEETTCTPPLWKEVLASIVKFIAMIISAVITIFGGVQNGVVLMTAVIAIFEYAVDQIVSLILYSPIDFIAGGAHSPKYDEAKGEGWGYLSNDIKGDYDLPDIYFVNTPYISGQLKWVGDRQTGNFIFVGSSGAKLKTIVNYDMVTHSFEIILENGVKLYFEIKDSAPILNISAGSFKDNNDNKCRYEFKEFYKKPIIQFWHLSNVVTPNGSDITFEYENISGIFYQQSNYIQVDRNNASKQVIGSNIDLIHIGSHPSEPNCFMYKTEVNNTTKSTFNFIKEVKTNNQKINFLYEYDRKDNLWYKDIIIDREDSYCSPYGYKPPDVIQERIQMPRLTNLELLNKDGVPIKAITFNTDYKLRPNTIYSEAVDNKSLTLQSMEISDGNYSNKYTVNFDYDFSNLNPSGFLNTKTGIPPESIGYVEHKIEERDIYGFYCPNATTFNNFNEVGSEKINLQGKPWAAAWSLIGLNTSDGLSVNWEYESNQYDAVNDVKINDGNYKSLGGIRVKQVNVKDKHNKDYSMSYFYTDTDGEFDQNSTNSSGHATVEPYNTILENDYRIEKSTRGGLHTPVKIAYEKVQVVTNFDNGNTPNGFTVYNFISSKDCPNGGLFGDIDNSWKRGMISSVIQYNKDKKIIFKKENSYKRVYGDHYNIGFVLPESEKTEKNNIKKEIEYKYAQDINLAEDMEKIENQIHSYISIPRTISDLNPDKDWVYEEPKYLFTTSYGDKNKDDVIIVEAANYRKMGSDGGIVYGSRINYHIACDIQWDSKAVKPTEYTSKNIYSFTGSIPDIPQKDLIYEQYKARIQDCNLSVNTSNIESVKIKYAPAGEYLSFDLGSKSSTPFGELLPSGEVPEIVFQSDYEYYIMINHYNTTRYIDVDGKPNQIISTKSNGKKKIIENTPAFTIPPYSDMKTTTSNLFTPIAQSKVCNDLTNESHVISASAQTFRKNSSGIWLPKASYKWKKDLQNGLLPQGEQFKNFNHSDLTQNTDWIKTDSITKYGLYNKVIETSKPNSLGGETYSSVIYGHNSLLAISSIGNAKYEECGILTCDFSEDIIKDDLLYIDYENGWKKNDCNLSDTKHFGEKSIYVPVSGKGPSKTLNVHGNKDYLFTAWVLPSKSGSLTFNVNIHLNGSNIPSQSISKTFSIIEVNKWKLLSYEIAKNELTNFDGVGGDYLDISISSSSADFHMDDIRFYPKNAFVTTNYYDQKLQLPILSVDENNNPSNIVEYDGLGRKAKVYKFKHNSINELITEIEYSP